MTDKPMSDADFLYARALDLDDCAPVYAEQMRAIAKRLEKIDAPAQVASGTSTSLPPLVADASFGDPIAHLNARGWLQKAVEAKGAKVTGAGMGCGLADLDITLDGCAFNLTIKPIMRSPT